ncbi:GAD-like domain-containing protein [Rheinheimera baltica]|uniref:GAD-like domain-containing protein n=1 Tax=Rheinheimera baltica TaxID=67576 RepID=UPI00273F0802|nr:GAD-like domain-containing protein [Rheinheimera baltica]MDP5143334.1 GAD-like domain-containing protein [Rheinheimera baltica]
MMNKFFDEFYNFAGFGPAIKAEMSSKEVLSFYKDKLPARLLEYWQEYGFCGWGDGIFWTVNPADYHDVLQTWLQGTEFERREQNGIDEYFVIGRGAFGRLFVWGKTSGQSIKINPSYGMLLPTDNTDNLRKRGEERSIELYFANKSKDSMDEKDLDKKNLFDRAMAKLGPLEADEMYAFVPALALGGTNKLENLQKVKIIEHLNFLAELGEKRVMADIVALSNALPHNK